MVAAQHSGVKGLGFRGTGVGAFGIGTGYLGYSRRRPMKLRDFFQLNVES